MLLDGCHEGKHTPRLSEVKCPRCGEPNFFNIRKGLFLLYSLHQPSSVIISSPSKQNGLFSSPKIPVLHIHDGDKDSGQKDFSKPYPIISRISYHSSARS